MIHKLRFTTDVQLGTRRSAGTTFTAAVYREFAHFTHLEVMDVLQSVNFGFRTEKTGKPVKSRFNCDLIVNKHE